MQAGGKAMSKHTIILVGCGEMANAWLTYVKERENASIVGLVDIKEENAKRAAKAYQLDVPIFTELKEALAQVEATIVIDVTIPSSHKEVVTRALKAGCHVFGEKPMAESMEDAREIQKVVRETGKTYTVMQNRRYVKGIRSLQNFVATGRIGKVGSIHADFFLGPHFGGFREVMDSPLLLDMAIHTFDQARCITGADPLSVYCHEFNPPGSWYEGNASAICIFEMSDGTVFTYRGSWCAEGLPTAWESDWRVTGSKGTVTWANFQEPQCEIIDETKPDAFNRVVKKVDLPYEMKGREGHDGCLDEMFAALEEGRLAETDSTDNFHSISMVLAAIESAKTGKKVNLV